MGRPIGILVDLQGPKIRLGTFPGGKRMLKEGERVRLVRKVASDDPTSTSRSRMPKSSRR